jgi:hypothetical protein
LVFCEKLSRPRLTPLTPGIIATHEEGPRGRR